MSQLEELRQIIVGDNSAQLAELRERLENVERRTEDVSEVLAPAINRTMLRDDSLIAALKQPVSEGLKKAIRAEPDEYADILYPAIAPSVRAAIAQAISSMLATINKTIESATTVGGIKARIESVRTGVPYAELLLRQSLLYKVEHLYLIDRESGLLIAECGVEGEGRKDSDAVSAMFSAIQSFVQDSFSGDEQDRLTDFKVGSHTVWIAHGPKAMLACVLWGDAPESLKTSLYTTLDKIRLTYAEQIQNFNVDAGQFDGVEHFLQPLISSQLREEVSSVQPSRWQVGPTLVYLGLAAAVGYWLFQGVDRGSKLATLNHYFAAAPGVVVTQSEWQGDRIVVDGLRDPDADLPLGILKAHGLDDDNLILNMTPFRSLETGMEMRRFRAELAPPEGVVLKADDGVISLEGEATVDWLLQHEERLRQLRADNRLEVGKLFATQKSLEEYLRSNLGLPAGQRVSELARSTSQTPWLEISFPELLRSLLSTSRR